MRPAWFWVLPAIGVIGLLWFIYFAEFTAFSRREGVRDQERAQRLSPEPGPPGPVAGAVRDTAGRAVPDLPVFLDSGPEGVHAGITDGEGRFRFPAVPAGRYRLVTASKGSLAGADLEVPSGTADLEVRLTPGLALRGRVLDLGGRAVPGQVSVHPEKDADLLRSRALPGPVPVGRAGDFRVPGLRPGRYRVRFLGPGHGPAERVVTPEQEVVLIARPL
jgi:hypothetical protein